MLKLEVLKTLTPPDFRHGEPDFFLSFFLFPFVFHLQFVQNSGPPQRHIWKRAGGTTQNGWSPAFQYVGAPIKPAR